MATNEERLAALEESLIQQQAASMTLLGIVQGIDSKLTEALGTVRSTQAHEAIIDARLSAIDARAQAAAAEMKLFKSDMERSFEQVAGEFALVARRLDGMATKQDLSELEERMTGRLFHLENKFDQVIALLTKQGE